MDFLLRLPCWPALVVKVTGDPSRTICTCDTCDTYFSYFVLNLVSSIHMGSGPLTNLKYPIHYCPLWLQDHRADFGVHSSCLTWCPLTSNCSALWRTIAVVCYNFFKLLYFGIKVDCEAVPWPQPTEAALTQLHIVSSHTLRLAVPSLDLVGKLEPQRCWLNWFLKLLNLCPRDDSWPGTKNPVLLQSGLERNSGVAYILFYSSFLHAGLVEVEVSGCYNK